MSLLPILSPFPLFVNHVEAASVTTWPGSDEKRRKMTYFKVAVCLCQESRCLGGAGVGHLTKVGHFATVIHSVCRGLKERGKERRKKEGKRKGKMKPKLILLCYHCASPSTLITQEDPKTHLHIYRIHICTAHTLPRKKTRERRGAKVSSLFTFFYLFFSRHTEDADITITQWQPHSSTTATHRLRAPFR